MLSTFSKCMLALTPDNIQKQKYQIPLFFFWY